MIILFVVSRFLVITLFINLFRGVMLRYTVYKKALLSFPVYSVLGYLIVSVA
jgi:hypothetical protein